MPMPRFRPDFSAAASHLRDDHVAFDERFADLCNRARAGDWREIDEVWDDFVDDVEAHLEFEEDLLFPDYAAESAQAHDLVGVLSGQHDQIRRTLQDLGVQIQLHAVRADTIENFVALLRAHADVENTSLYPWAARHDDRVAAAPQPAAARG